MRSISAGLLAIGRNVQEVFYGTSPRLRCSRRRVVDGHSLSSLPVTHRCSECGRREERSDRVARTYRDRPFVCSNCRRPERAKPSQADRRHWLERFSLEEIRELAFGIWGPLS